MECTSAAQTLGTQSQASKMLAKTGCGLHQQGLDITFEVWRSPMGALHKLPVAPSY